jgi:hypothetical protein
VSPPRGRCSPRASNIIRDPVDGTRPTAHLPRGPDHTEPGVDDHTHVGLTPDHDTPDSHPAGHHAVDPFPGSHIRVGRLPVGRLPMGHVHIGLPI